MTGPGYNRRSIILQELGGEVEVAECPLWHLSPDPAKFRLFTPSKNTLGPDPCWKPEWTSQFPLHFIPTPPAQGLGRKSGFQGGSTGDPLSTGKTPCLDF